MSAETVLAAAAAVSAAIVFVLALRLPLRRHLGACAAYALWAAVPLAGVAALLPSGGTRLSLPLALSEPATVVTLTPVSVTVASGASLPWFAVWLAGCVAMLAVQALQQWQFQRRSGVQQRRGALRTAAVGPCVSGLWRPAILLPLDFRQRYDRRERRLVLAHEIAHLRCGDLPVNALVALLRALFWFNPLLHAALRGFRLDQELACDARVLARFPEARRCYAGAMLKTQLGEAVLRDGPGPLGCGWFSPHPLKERIAMLHHPVPARRRRRFGLACAAVLAVASAGLAWAAKPGPATAPAAAASASEAAYVDAQFTLRIGSGAEQRFRMINRFGEPFLATVSDSGVQWEAQFVATPVGSSSIRLSTTFRRDGATVAQPELLLREGERGGLAIDGEPGQGSLQLDAVVRRSATPTPPGAEALSPR